MEKAQMEKGEQLVQAMVKSLSETGVIMDEVVDSIPSVAEGLRFAQDRDAFEKVSVLVNNLEKLFEYVSSLQEAVEVLKKYGLELDSAVFSLWESAGGYLKEITSAFEREDWVYAADLFQYELHPLLAESVTRLKKLAEGLEEK